MKHILLIVALICGLCLPAGAQDDGSHRQKIVRNLLNAGLEALQKKLDDKAAEPAGVAAPQSVAQPGTPLSQLVHDTLEQALSGVKDEYINEGRLLARQIGDTLAERILSNPKVQKTLQTLDILFCSLIGYLVFVTLGLLVSLHSLKKSNKRILQLLEELRAERK